MPLLVGKGNWMAFLSVLPTSLILNLLDREIKVPVLY